jgi:predicted dinucleotide-binding enzyme
MTSIAILGGTGYQGSGLARRFAAAGARVIVGSRDPDRARTVVSAWNAPIPTIPTIDVGPLSRAQSIEHLTLLAIAVNRRHKVTDARYRIVGLTTRRA